MKYLMEIQRQCPSLRLILKWMFAKNCFLKLCIILFSSIGCTAHGSPSLITIASFNGTNGSGPIGRMIQTSDGSFYGSTVSGGTGGYGVVFATGFTGSLTNLVSFDQTNGVAPQDGLGLGTDGNIYGTAYYGGASNLGTVFELMATNITVLISFNNTNGAYPVSSLTSGADGNLYGTTAIGGLSNSGTVFQFATNRSLATLYSFGNGTNDGYSPYTGVIQGIDGSLYGTTFLGGTNNLGTLFRIATNGAYSSLHSFSGLSDGANPYASLMQYRDGILYGSTFLGGFFGYGTVFKISTNGSFTTLLSFGNTNGAYPRSAMVVGPDDALYGTTSFGGTYTNSAGNTFGTVFRMTTNGTLSTLVSFAETNGANPMAPLILGSDGNFYGTTFAGGAYSNGTVYKLALAAEPPQFLSEMRSGSSLSLTWSTEAGETYQIQYKTNLTQAAWSNLGGAIQATNNSATILDAIGPDRQRFYRAVLMP